MSGEAPAVVVLVMAKAPVPGEVKTRLCPPATVRGAATIAAASLLDTLEAVHRTPGCRPVVALSGSLHCARQPRRIRRALHGATVLPQHGPDFGQRLANAHADSQNIHSGLSVTQIGMDTPQVSPELLAEARIRDAEDVDALLGLAEDGGWWAVGFRNPRFADLLREIPTSRADTGQRTLHAMRMAGLRVRLLPDLSDVDTMRDAVQVAALVPESRFSAALAAERDRAPLPAVGPEGARQLAQQTWIP